MAMVTRSMKNEEKLFWEAV